MSVTGPKFLIFLLGVIMVYYIVPKRFQWFVLLAASLCFYMLSGPVAFLYMLFTIVTTWAAGLGLASLDKKTKRAARKAIVAAALTLNFGLLFLVKYVPGTGLIMPMGLSFYIFQASGYVIDLYRAKYEPRKNILKFTLFISYFPQVIQGPISRYNDLGIKLFDPHEYDPINLRNGIQLMLWGYIKKLVVANRLSVLVSSVYDCYQGHGGAVYLFATVLSVVQLYCDFSGGIDIISGASQCLGITLTENFRRPIFAVSLADYWQRWHISLYTWLRDYLFYPVAFSKPFIKIGEWSRKNFKGKAGKSIPTTLASFVVYFVIGIWHGAGWGYFAFAVFNAAVITLSNIFPVLLKTPKWVGIIRTWALVVISEFLIRGESLRLGLRMLSNVFTNFQAHEIFDSGLLNLGLSAEDFVITGLWLAVLVILETLQEKGIKIRDSLAEKSVTVQLLCILVPLIFVIFYGFCGSAVDAAFIYGNF